MTKVQSKYGLKVENVSPDVLKPSKWNPNVVSPDNEARLEESLKRNGFFKPALVRELEDGSLEIVGGEHRVMAAKRLGYTEVPVISLGKITDKKAKELCLLDNGRYGADDSLQLGLLLEELGNSSELAEFLPYSEADLNEIFSSRSIELDMLDMNDDEAVDLTAPVISKPIQTHQIMRFKVPYEDAPVVQAVIESIMKRQGYSQEDSLTNAGHALVHICNNH